MAGKAKKIIVDLIIYMVVMVRSFFLIPHGVCRYTPSCTTYTREALTLLPLHRAIVAIIKRLLRCHPLSRGGYDPVCPAGKDK